MEAEIFGEILEQIVYRRISTMLAGMLQLAAFQQNAAGRLCHGQGRRQVLGLADC
jgi:hypothetical protein